ncbi:hypothetical protein VB780_24605 [Leptolyngbya sp. CCNP1308]|uniref:hypothetical protein n=1 Tax=Leptolyngbya sp. CCNP1308 TaxID=3110255 RepID=UPI002B21779F|nr:hypothetical protein [Leptolyngbya sp. CCNP1308]MEA5451781.1 hypothetical protein [Leptolyngbya sp. CCNP1308]
MLTLPLETPSPLVLARDDSDRDCIYAVAARPRLARHGDGRPRLSLTRWHAPGASMADSPITGARLSLEIDLSPETEALAAAGVDPAKVQPFPWVTAQLQLDAPGMAPAIAEVFTAGHGPTGLSLDLPPTTAELLASLLEGTTTSPLQLTWRGTVMVRLPAAKVVAIADRAEIQHRLQSVQGEEQTLVKRAVTAASARITIEGVADAAVEAALREWAIAQLAERFDQGQDLLVQATTSDLVPWPIHLAGTLDDAVDKVQHWDVVHDIQLDGDDLGNRPPLSIQVLGNFEGALERVDVQLQPADGDPVELAISDGQEKFLPPPAATFRWRYRAKAKIQPVGDWSDWRSGQSGHGLVISVTLPSHLDLEVLAAGLDLTQRWQSVRVELEHTLPGLAPVSHVVKLDQQNPSDLWHRPLNGIRGTVTATLTYLSYQGLSVEQTVEIAGDQLVVSEPLAIPQRQVTLVPQGSGWDDVSAVMVDLRHCDGDVCFEETLELTQPDTLAQWKAPARDAAPTAVAWRYHASFADGRFEQSPWHTTDDRVIVISIAGLPRRDVQILPIYFDATTTRQIDLTLAQGEQVRTAVITSTAPQTLSISPGPYRWSARRVLSDGTEVNTEEKPSDVDLIMFPPHPS